MFTLEAKKRDIFGKKLKAERNLGILPAVFYGRKEKATPISVGYADFLKVWKQAGESSVITLAYPKKELSVLINDVAFDPVRGEPIHADFYVIESDREVEVEVPLEFEGVAPAVKETGGTLVKVLHTVLVSGLPKDLPQGIKVDLSPLRTLEDHIMAKDLTVPQGITIRSDADEIIVLVAALEEEIVEEQKSFDALSVEVEKKGKKEEDGDEESPEKDKL